MQDPSSLAGKLIYRTAASGHTCMEPYDQIQDDKLTDRCPELRVKQAGDEAYYYCNVFERGCQVEYGNYPCYVLSEFKRKKEG